MFRDRDEMCCLQQRVNSRKAQHKAAANLIRRRTEIISLTDDQRLEKQTQVDIGKFYKVSSSGYRAL